MSWAMAGGGTPAATVVGDPAPALRRLLHLSSVYDLLQIGISRPPRQRLRFLGLTPLQALQAATLNPAKAIPAADSLGTVAAGTLADLVLLDANPLADITNATQIRAVVANGRHFDRAAFMVP